MVSGLAALRILVIDDNPQMRTIVGAVLTAAGLGQLCYAQDGEDGLEVMAQHEVDLAYVDYEMPKMNGLDFLSAVRSLKTDQRYMPIIMLTGHSDRVRLNAARDRGVTEFVAKPVTPRTILTRLNAAIVRPRPFVQSQTFFGPDRRRRRRQPGGYAGPLRRATDSEDFLEV
jgi:DNA-binding response OmpR family regulator